MATLLQNLEDKMFLYFYDYAYCNDLFLWLSFKQIESNYSKKEHCERGSWIITFSHCLDLGYCKYGIITKKKWCEMNNFWYFFKKSSFHFDVFSGRVSFPFKCGKPLFGDLEG